MSSSRFAVLYSDIGGVLGTNGWDTHLRRKIAAHFEVDFDQIESRHHLMFDSYERGFLTFEDYLRHVFFSAKRPFTLADVRAYTYEASTPWPENLRFFGTVKERNSLKFGLISNEGEGITQHRVQKFGLREVADFMVISHFVHMRKPDRAIWELALDLAQASPSDCIYIDDREMFTTVAAEMGFTAVQHTSLEKTRERLKELGLKTE